MLAQRARDNLAAVAFCNLVGGQDELVFDGHSLVVDHDGRRDRARAAVRRGAARLRRRPRRRRCAARLRDTRLRPPVRRAAPARRRRWRGSRAARGAGRRRRARRRGRAAARARGGGLRGARRSACATTSRRTASSTSCSASRAASTRRSSRCIAVDALGAERVTCVDHALAATPRDGTQADARDAGREPRRRAARAADRSRRWRPTTRLLAPPFDGPRARHHRGEPAGAHPRQPADGAVEQVRLARATTGNKSEMSVGYSTLYGDMAGGFAVIKDVPKTLVYGLVARPQRDAPTASSDPGLDHRPPALAPSCAPTSATRTRCRPTTSLDAILEAYVEEDREPRAADRARACRAATSTA